MKPQTQAVMTRGQTVASEITLFTSHLGLLVALLLP